MSRCEHRVYRGLAQRPGRCKCGARHRLAGLDLCTLHRNLAYSRGTVERWDGAVRQAPPDPQPSLWSAADIRAPEVDR